MHFICRTGVVLLLFTLLGYTQDAVPPDRETIQQLVQQVKELQGKVRVLESRNVAAEAPAPDSSHSDADSQTESLDSRLPARDAQEPHEVHGIQWRGFGEVNYKVLDQRKPELGTYGFVPGSHGDLYTGDFDLLLTSRINDKAGVLAEIVFGEQDAQKFGVDLDRVLLKYDYNDHLRMSFGRFHTGIGYYNTVFHSGSWLQTTAIAR